jgi:hypothetical protein
MKLFEEFKLYETMWDEPTAEVERAELATVLKNLEKTLDEALAAAKQDKLANVLIMSKPGYGAVNACKDWAKRQNGVNVRCISIANSNPDDINRDFDKNTVIILTDIKPGAPEALSAFVNGDNLLTIGVVIDTGKRVAISRAQSSLFNFKFDFDNLYENLGNVPADTDINGVKVITIWDDNEADALVQKFNTFEEAAKHYEAVYINAVEEEYAEEVLYPILRAAEDREYDYIDSEGYAVIEARNTKKDYLV